MNILYKKQFNTGRGYTAEGQLINAWLVDIDGIGRLLYFMDVSRHVYGTYKFNNDSIQTVTEGTIMTIYDKNLHDSGVTKENGERFYDYELQNMLIESGETSKDVKGW